MNCPRLGQSWRSTSAVFFGSTGETLKLTVITLVIYYRRSTDYYYFKNTDIGGYHFHNSTGLVLAVYRMQILAINRHRNLIASWHSTGLLLVQY